ncbi:MAG TPA: beta-ketoacyl-ACP synthase II [Thermomicrobiales bacterium]|nr:beta-ketoacyl-ACP synthase II [Thermomicrobiales bacterium]
MTRAVVTGLGAVTPLGIGVDTFWEGLTAGRSGIRKIQSFDASGLDVQIAGEVPDFNPADHMDIKKARRMDRFSQFGVAAAREAIEHACLEITDDNRERIGIMMNTGGGGIPTIASEVRVMEERGPKRVGSLVIPLFAPNMASCQVAIMFDIHGPTVTSVAACAAGVQAFVDAVAMIERGDVEVVITGGTEAAIIPVAIASLSNMRALSRCNEAPERASRPFDADRDGFVFSEGAAAAILESEEHAARRGATPIAFAHGGYYTSDAYHITAPDPSGRGAATAMRGALRRAELEPTDIDYVAAHATATTIGDIAETNMLKNVYGGHAYNLSISANKSMVGHLLGAAGAVSALTCILAIRDGVIPPTINLDTPDPECDLDYTPNTKREREVRAAVANGFGFGGQNACAAFTAPE